MLAKLQGAERKRKRDEEMDMDMDGDGADGEAEDGWMDVDGEDRTPNKRVKANSGAVIAPNKRAPRSNRQLAGMRDEAVRIPESHIYCLS